LRIAFVLLLSARLTVSPIGHAFCRRESIGWMAAFWFSIAGVVFITRIQKRLFSFSGELSGERSSPDKKERPLCLLGIKSKRCTTVHMSPHKCWPFCLCTPSPASTDRVRFPFNSENPWLHIACRNIRRICAHLQACRTDDAPHTGMGVRCLEAQRGHCEIKHPGRACKGQKGTQAMKSVHSLGACTGAEIFWGLGLRGGQRESLEVRALSYPWYARNPCRKQQASTVFCATYLFQSLQSHQLPSRIPGSPELE